MELALREAEFENLRAAPPILYQMSHPPKFMPAMIATYAAIIAYQLEKKLTDGSYSKAGLYIGMKPSTISSHEVKDVAELRAAVLASGTVPPFMPVTRFKGRVAVDGGLVDNPPVQLLKPVEEKGGRTLVLATRFAPSDSKGNRLVLRPSQALRVDKFSIIDGEGIKQAYEQGLRDGEAFMREIT
jgi:Patatin-like phospholipase